MAETVAQLLVTLGADVSELKKGLQEAQGQLEAIRKKTDQTGQGFSKLQANVVTLNAAIDLAKTAYQALSAVSGTLFASIQSVIEAASDQEDAQLLLRNALELTGQASDEVIDSYDAQASALQNTSRFADEAVTSVQALLTRFKVAPQEMAPATQAIADFAAATGQDIEAAAESFGRAIEGQTRGLKAYGITLEDTGSRSKNLANVVEALSERFGGAAQASVTNFRGSLIVLGNVFGEVQETVGSFFTQSEEGARIVAFISEEINRLSGFLKENKAEFQSLTDEGVKTFALFIIDAAAAVLSVGSAVETVGKKIAAFAAVLTTPFSNEAFKTALADLTGTVETESGKALEKLAEFRARFEDFGAQVPKNVTGAVGALEKVPAAVETAKAPLPALTAEATKTGEALGKVGDKFADDATPKFKEGVERINEALDDLRVDAATAELPPLQQEIERTRAEFEKLAKESPELMGEVARSAGEAADLVREKFRGDIFGDYRRSIQEIAIEQELYTRILGKNATEQERLNKEVSAAQARVDAAKQAVIDLRNAGFSPLSEEVLVATNNLRLANQELGNASAAAQAATQDIFTVGEAFDELGAHVENFFKIGQTRSFTIGVDLAALEQQVNSLIGPTETETDRLHSFQNQLNELADDLRHNFGSPGNPFEGELRKQAAAVDNLAAKVGLARFELERFERAERSVASVGSIAIPVRLTGIDEAERELADFSGRNREVTLHIKASGSPTMDFSSYFPAYAESQVDKFNASLDRKPITLGTNLGEITGANGTTATPTASTESIGTLALEVTRLRLSTERTERETRGLRRGFATGDYGAALSTRNEVEERSASGTSGF